MQLLSRISDGRVNCENLLLEMSIGEYLRFAEAALGHNEFREGGSKALRRSMQCWIGWCGVNQPA
jgi:hypothetical protein